MMLLLVCFSTDVPGTSSLAFCTTLVSRWSKARRHGTPGPPQGVKQAGFTDAQTLLPQLWLITLSPVIQLGVTRVPYAMIYSTQ